MDRPQIRFGRQPDAKIVGSLIKRAEATLEASSATIQVDGVRRGNRAEEIANAPDQSTVENLLDKALNAATPPHPKQPSMTELRKIARGLGIVPGAKRQAQLTAAIKEKEKEKEEAGAGSEKKKKKKSKK